MEQLTFIIPPLSGEGIYYNENIKRRPFDFISVNFLLSILQKKYQVSFYDLDLEGIFTTNEFNNALYNSSFFVIYITEGHPHRIIDLYIDLASCPVLIIGPGALKYKNQNCTIIEGEPEFEIINTLESIENDTALNRKTITKFNSLNKLPLADHSNIELLKAHKGYPSILISRGCNNICSFCHSNDYYVPTQRAFRRRSIDNILAEIRCLKRKNISFFHLECETFSPPVEDQYTDIFLKNLKQENIFFSTFFNVPILTNLEFVKKLFKSGCRFVFLGIESSFDPILKHFKKPHTYTQAIQAIENLNFVGIQFGIGFLPYNPYTTKESLLSDINFIEYIIEKKFSHPLNIYSIFNICKMPYEYALELSIENIYLKITSDFSEKIKTQLSYYEKTTNTYPERYTSQRCIFDNTEILKTLKEMVTCPNSSMNEIEIKKIEKKDVAFLYTLMNMPELLSVLNELPSSLEIWQQAFIEWQCDNDEENYIIFRKNQSIGWIGLNGLSSKTKEIFIKVIAIVPEYQNLGIGQYVITETIKNLKLRGFEKLSLYTDKKNSIAQECYKKCGFKLTDEIIQKMSNGKYIRRYKMDTNLKETE